MNKVKIFLTLTGYQITWLACVFGEKNFNQPLLGLSFGLFFIIIYFYYSINKKQLLKTILLISLPGYFFDTFMIYLSIYKFNAILNIGFLPIWMLVLWPSFAILFDEILVFFKNYKLIGILLSGLLGPITYYLGAPLGLILINDLLLFFFLMISFWSLLMFFYLNLILKNY